MQQSKLLVATNHETMQQKKIMSLATIHSRCYNTPLRHNRNIFVTSISFEMQHPQTTVATSRDNGCNIPGQRLQHPRTMVATSPDNGCNITNQKTKHLEKKRVIKNCNIVVNRMQHFFYRCNIF